MRIEINAGGISGLITISEYQANMTAFINNAESVIESFKSVSTATYSLSGGVGNLQSALDNINARIAKEEAKKNAAIEVHRKSNNFLSLAIRVDKDVARLVDRNKDQFYRVHPWLKPVSIADKLRVWIDEAWKWIIGIRRTIDNGVARVWDWVKDTAAKAWNGIVEAKGERSWAAAFLNNDLKTSGSYLYGEKSGEGEFLGASTSGTITGSFLYGEAGVKNKFWWKDEDGNFDFKSFGLKSEAKATGALAKGTAEGNWGYLHGKAEGAALTAAVSGEAKATLWDDGKFNPSLFIGAKAEGSVLQGNVETGFGTDQYGVYVKADGDVLHAEAEAKAGVGYIGTDKNGNARYGAEAKASAMASIAQGRVKGGFTIFGIDIDIGVKGYAGAVGAEAGASVSSDGFKVNASGAFGGGGGLDISVDWSSAKWVGNTVDAVSKFFGGSSKAAGAIKGGAVSYVKNAGAVAGKTVNYIKDAGAAFGKSFGWW